MKSRILSLAVLASFGAVSISAVAAPVKLNKTQMDQVVAGKITTLQVNGGGNTPNGNANGVPTVSINPAGQQPPGQNQ